MLKKAKVTTTNTYFGKIRRQTNRMAYKTQVNSLVRAFTGQFDIKNLPCWSVADLKRVVYLLVNMLLLKDQVDLCQIRTFIYSYHYLQQSCVSYLSRCWFVIR